MTFKTIEAELMPFLDKIEETRADDMLLFAYYCMFAAIAVEFVAAVYYTFQLN